MSVNETQVDAITMDDVRAWLADFGDEAHEWAGVPVPVPDLRLQIEDSYPYKALENIFKPDEEPDEPARPLIWVRNRWYSRSRRKIVTITEDENGKIGLHLSTPSHSYASRISHVVNCMGAIEAWDLEAEYAARDKLRSMVTPHIYKMYELTGGFMEQSAKSGLTYIFRRCRPTVVITPMRRYGPYADVLPMKCLIALCLHPIAFYLDSYAGAMVPTDDVIAHLLMMRGDEHFFWRKANQHPLWSSNAGL